MFPVGESPGGLGLHFEVPPGGKLAAAAGHTLVNV